MDRTELRCSLTCFASRALLTWFSCLFRPLPTVAIFKGTGSPRRDMHTVPSACKQNIGCSPEEANMEIGREAPCAFDSFGH